jgi:hypothetical protein
LAGFGHNDVVLKGSATKVLVRSSSGRAISQAVSRRLPTATARVRSQVKSCGIYGAQSGTGAGFLRVLLFSFPILIPPTDPYSSVIRAGTI